MRSDKKKVLTNSLLYTSGNILLKFFSFLLIPLYTAFLVPEQYGIVNLALGFVNVFSCIIMGGLQFSVIRFYADFKEEQCRVAAMISSVIWGILIIGLIGAGLLIVSQHLWIQLIFETIPFLPIVLLAILISIVTALYTVYQDILKGMQQAKKSIILSYVFFFFLLGSNILTVVVFKQGANGILVSTFIVNMLMTLLMVVDLSKQKILYLNINFELLKELFKYSLPLVPHTLSYNISSFFSRIIINSKMTTSMLGLYTLASQFGGVADVVGNSVQAAFQPWMFSKLNENNNINNNEIRVLTNQLLWLYGLIYLVIGSFAKEAIDIMTNISYHAAWQYVPFLIMAVAIKSPLYFYLNFLYYHKNKTKFVFVTTLIACITGMIFTWLLVPILGIYGAILADIVALIIRTIATIRFSYNEAHEIYSFFKIAIITLFSIIFLGLSVIPSYFELIPGALLNILYKMCCILVYCVLIVRIYNVNVYKLVRLRTIFLKR